MIGRPKVSRDDARAAVRRRSKTLPSPGPVPRKEALGVRTLITRARGAVLSSFDTELERYGVTGAQFEVLKNLYRNTVETGASLCRALHYDTGSMTRMLDRLEEKGLVRRQRDGGDRRVVLLRLTETGERLLPRIRPAARRALRRHLVDFTPREIESLKAYLGRIIANGRRPEAQASEGVRPRRSRRAAR